MINNTYNYHKCTVIVTLQVGTEYQTYSKDYHILADKKERHQLYTKLNLIRGVGEYEIGGLTQVLCTADNHKHDPVISSNVTPLKVVEKLPNETFKSVPSKSVVK